MLPRRHWLEHTTTDFEHVADWVAVIPTAAIEQHGPHLPVGVDTIIGQGMVDTVIEQLPDDIPATFLPIQTIGKSNEHLNYPGTLTFDWETTIRAWIELGESVARTGVRKIVFANSHGGNTALLEVITRELRVRHNLLAVQSAWMKFGDGGACGDDEMALGIHGGLLETAMVLHFRPDLVRMDKAVHFDSRQSAFLEQLEHLRVHGGNAFGWMAEDLNPAGTVGNAAGASAELGARIAQHQAAGFITLLREVAELDVSFLGNSFSA